MTKFIFSHLYIHILSPHIYIYFVSHPGDEITTEWRGKWCSASVVDVDCSLARVHFVEQSIKEWIYRGSTRCENVYVYGVTVLQVF